MATKKNAEANEAPVMDLAEIQKQIAEMLAAAKAEAEAIVNAAKEAADEMNAPAKAKAEAEAKAAADKAYMEELVEIKLFKDNGKYKDDVFVGCNGETIAIKRGERVMVKRKFVEILENSEHQDYETAKLIDQKSGQFERDVAAGKL